MARTARQIIGDALRLLKVKEAGEALDDSQASDGLVALNDILEEWNLQNLAQTNRVKLTQALTASDGTYTFGVGGDNTTRPLWIETAFVRDGSNDYPIRVIGNEEYSEIFFKTLNSSYPYNLYYRAEYPLASLELYPVPSGSNLTLHLECPAAFDAVSDLDDSLDYAPGYLKALKYQLAVAIAPEYKMPDTFALTREIAKETWGWIKRVNQKDKRIMRTPYDRRDGIGFFLRRGRR